MTLVELQDVSFGYTGRSIVKVDRLVLSDGQCLGIFGPNGAGKTTLVRGITGLLPPIDGIVRHDRPDLRFGYLPQHRAMETHWPMTALDAASMATSARRFLGWMRGAGNQVRQSMARMEVEHLAGHRFSKLSGGQQQRILLAGALASSPSLLVLDEPTDGLDVKSRKTLLEILRAEIQRGLCAVMISHDIEDLIVLSDMVAWLHPSADENQPSTIELVSSEAFAQRVLRYGSLYDPDQ